MAVVERLQPRDAATVAKMLKHANTERLTVEVRGGGTKSLWNSQAAPADLVLSTLGLKSGIDHVAGDLTAKIPSGATLDEVNGALSREQQWLPIDAPHGDRATIGGIVATNDSGPRRHRFGTPRDLIIGIEFALVDGRIARAGGRVVKNVAGYDLSRLLCGSLGSLAVITGATFKLAPLAPTSRTVVVTSDRARPLCDLTSAIAAAPLSPSATELSSHPWALMVRFETISAAAEQQSKQAAALSAQHGARVVVLDGDAEQRLWNDLESRFWTDEGAVAKISVLPSDVAELVDHIERASSELHVEWQLLGRAALGVLFVRVLGDPTQQAAIISELRRSVSTRRGTVVLLSAPADVKRRVDSWGDLGDALPLMQAVKARFDPHGTLNPGCGI